MPQPLFLCSMFLAALLFNKVIFHLQKQIKWFPLRFCVPLYCLQDENSTPLKQIKPHKYFSITNASINDAGIPACVCYVRSGTENGYDVYYSK